MMSEKKSILIDNEEYEIVPLGEFKRVIGGVLNNLDKITEALEKDERRLSALESEQKKINHSLSDVKAKLNSLDIKASSSLESIAARIHNLETKHSNFINSIKIEKITKG